MDQKVIRILDDQTQHLAKGDKLLIDRIEKNTRMNFVFITAEVLIGQRTGAQAYLNANYEDVPKTLKEGSIMTIENIERRADQYHFLFLTISTENPPQGD